MDLSIGLEKEYPESLNGFNRFTSTLDNTRNTRLDHSISVKNLYLSGACTKSGPGCDGVIYSGLECFGEIMKNCNLSP